MGNFVANISKGRFVHYCTMPETNDGIIVVPLEATGIVADDALKDYDTLDALLTGATNEQTTMGRKTISGASVTVTVDDTNNRVDVDAPDQTWTGATGNAISDVVFCYDPDTTGGADTAIIPMTYHDFALTPDGSDVVLQVAAAGFGRAQD